MTPQLGPVLVVGTGLVGTSVGLALRRASVDVHLADVDPAHVRVAESRGAGSRELPARAWLVVVAVPPDHVAAAVVQALRDWPAATVTDVGSVKAAPLAAVSATDADVSRYVGSHPMAGSEQSGPWAASADLFDGRAWAVTPHADADASAVAGVRALAQACGASVVEMTVTEHDATVARVSHLPHLMSVLTAARLVDGPDAHLELAGQGLRDVTRVAGGDPGLWQQILRANAGELTGLLRAVRDDVDVLLGALTSPADLSPGSDRFRSLDMLLGRGQEGTRLIPGKHGAPATAMVTVFVAVPDRPGELARLFADAGRSGVNVEDVHIDHDPARDVGLVELLVGPGAADRLVAALTALGWSAHR